MPIRRPYRTKYQIHLLEHWMEKGEGYFSQGRAGDFIHEVRKMRPDIILMDKNLDWADGCDLCAMIKANVDLQHIPVIMFSAYHKLKEDCLFAGADAFVEKPFEMKELLETIHSFTKPGQEHVT
jgi:CheY-like chemotaxis protein